MSSKCGAALWVLGAIGYLVLEALSAAGYPHYSYADNYISDLGVAGSRTHVMHVAFCSYGVLFLLGAVLVVGVPARRRARIFLAMAAANAAGNIVVGTVYSGKVHVAGAALAIMGGNVAVAAGSGVVGISRRWYRRGSELVAALGLLSLTILVVDSRFTDFRILPDGVFERGSVYSITIWQLLTAGCLLAAEDSAPDSVQ
ncbi:DUF998 domain-containing protein [Mycobacterium asiaticum]|uniref:DUF998 domain-containing protein n=1 Tax=Mycobacterium asiaticum TaxID=1790 RepID=A0A1A3NK96_MYCAS|nr:DUF998 domain-containing protein [Mycobacterium asiaticum]OBK21474.1 hypothetical protein A5635_22945 [Mycobacterium asiaticum]